MCLAGARWGEIKNQLSINSKVLRDILQSLRDVMIVEEHRGYYQITDPMLRRTVKRLRVRQD